MNAIAILQVIVALGLLNVWILRYSKETVYRGGTAKTLKDEFAAYGLPTWFHYLIGALKIGSAVALLIGLGSALVALGGASVVVVLMLGALAMHLKVKDPIKKSVPAFLMLAMSSMIVWSYLAQ